MNKGDAHLVDAAVDGLTLDASVEVDAGPPISTLVTVVDTHGAPVAGANVYFQSANSTLLATVLTDSQGHADAAISSGGFITVALSSPYRNRPTVSTFANVIAGEPVFFESAVQLSYVPFVGAQNTTLAVSFDDLSAQQQPVDTELDVMSPDPLQPYQPLGWADVPPANGVASSQFSAPSGQTLIVETDFTHAGNVQNRILDWLPSTTSYNVHVLGTLLHPFTTLPTFEAGVVSWQEGPTGVGANYVYSDLSVGSYLWQVVAHADGTSLALPQLPPGIDQSAPTFQGLVIMASSVDLLPHFFATDFDERFVRGAQGRVVFEIYEVTPAPMPLRSMSAAWRRREASRGAPRVPHRSP